MTSSDVIVIGAGLSGLLAAQTMQAGGLQVTVIDKAQGVGGRMATRRIGDAVFDHGAQYFTVRDARFREVVRRFEENGVVAQWANGFVDAEGQLSTGDVRWRGTEGMTSLPKAIAETLDIHLEKRVVSVDYQKNSWHVVTEAGETYQAKILLLTPPVPQSLVLLDIGNYSLPTKIKEKLEAITYNHCFAVMAVLDGPSGIPAPGGMWPSREPISWIADNQQKGISSVPSVTIHTGPEFSRLHLTVPDDDIAEQLFETAGELIGSKVVSYQVHRWLYSQPAQPYPDPYVLVDKKLAFAGDAFAGPRVEGAAISGLMVGKAILANTKK